MGLGSVNGQNDSGYTILELKVPLKQAIEKVKDDGLDEVFFKAGDKDYVAYGKGIDADKFKSSLTSYNGEKVNISFVDNEINTAEEGTKYGTESVPGLITIGVGAVVGGFIALSPLCIGLAAEGFTIASAAATYIFVGMGAGAGLGVTGVIGDAYGRFRSADYAPINEITNK